MSFEDGVRREGKRYICQVAGYLLRNAPDFNPGGTGFNGPFNQWFTRTFCNRPPTPDEDDIPPTCEGVDYDVAFTECSTDFGENPPIGVERCFSGTARVRGPIFRIGYDFAGVVGVGPYTLVIEHRQPGSTTGVRKTAIGGTNNPDAGALRYTIHSITPVGAEPPSCTGIVPRYDPDPGRFNFPDDFTYTDDNGIDINIPVIVAVGQVFVDINGQVNVPINIDFRPALNVDANFNFDIDVNFPVGGGEPTIRGPGGGGQPPSQPPPRPPGNDDFDPVAPPPAPPEGAEPEEKEEKPDDEDALIRAVLVTVTDIADGVQIGELGQGANPNVFYPDLGLVQFSIGVGNSAIGWTDDLRVKNRRHFIPCPWDGGAFAVRGTPRPGVEWILTPIYDRVPAQGGD